MNVLVYEGNLSLPSISSGLSGTRTWTLVVPVSERNQTVLASYVDIL